MAIIFNEERELVDGSTVEAGKEYTFPPEEEAAFVGNGVATLVPVKPTAKAKEVVDNG